MQVGAASQQNASGKKRFMRFGVPGMADILAFPVYSDGLIAGRIIPFWLEVKTAEGKQSEMQKSFQAQVENARHKYAVVRSIEDVEQALR